MRGPIADHRTCQPGRGQNRPARSEHADALARRHEPASSSLPGNPMTSYKQASENVRRTVCHGYTANEIVVLTLRWERASDPACWAKGTDCAVFMLSQAGEMTDEMPAQSASRVIPAVKSSGEIFRAPLCRAQTVLLSGCMPRCRRFR